MANVFSEELEVVPQVEHKPTPRKYLYWGPFPWEQDGGAVVNYYLLKEQYKIRQDKYYGVSKVPEELDPTYTPFVNFYGYPIVQKHEDMAKVMAHEQIPLMNIFHLGPIDFEKVLDPVHEIGGKVVLHQTIHWPDDQVLTSDRLDEFDGIVCPTQYAKQVFIGSGKIKPYKLKYIPHAVDTSKYYKNRNAPLRAQLGIRPDQKIIMYSGRLSFWKGMQELIPIMRSLYNEYDCVFIIRGGAFQGNEESMGLYRVFNRLAWKNPNIRFIPTWQSPEFMEQLHCITDITVFNSGHEGFGVPLIEAMATESIPITTALANHVEICGYNGERALLLDPRKQVGVVNDDTPIKVASSVQIDKAIRWILDNQEEAEILGENGREKVLAQYDLAKVSQQWLDYYDKLIPEGYNMDEEVVKRLE